ncbi:YwiC-like family protein [Fischerella major]|uniref:YwiC-like family protein n=1 Tax=Fischerella major TaxID=210993 RepID=UPI0009FFBA00|nr:YwiC-like family protein [Fischerella major]
MTATPNSATPSPLPHKQVEAISHKIPWYRPTFSPEHGVYVILIVSFLTGAAAAQGWTLATTLAFICAFAGFQAEYPLTLQIKQRHSWKPRLLVWGSIGAYLALQTPMLLWLYLGAIAAFLMNGVAVFYRKQKSIWNEFLTFAAVCLAAPLAAIATTGTATISLFGLWLLNTLFFSSAIFTVKLRKPKPPSLAIGLAYHGVAVLIIAALCFVGWLPSLAAIAFGIVLLKFGFILSRREWYQTTVIKHVAVLETLAAVLFLGLSAIALLPAYASAAVQSL